MRVLLIEDDAGIVAFVRQGLAEAGFTVDVAADGPEGLAAARVAISDVIILDGMLPGLDGLAVLAMGLNEAAGYLAVSLAALGAGYLAATYALRPQPFVLGIIFAVAGLLLSLFFVRESQGHAALEARQHHGDTEATAQPSFAHILLLTSWKDRALFSVSQAGMVNNLNDGMAWGLFPLYFALAGLSIRAVGC